MSILKIARIGHPVLHKEASPVKDFNDPEVLVCGLGLFSETEY